MPTSGDKPKTIVIIEDDSDTQEIYYDMLSQERYRIFPASSGQLGIHLAQTELPDLIILDILLPGELNGIKVLDRLKKHAKTKTIPVLVVSNLQTDIDPIITQGAEDFLVKSQTSIDTLLSKVQKLTGDRS